MDPSVQSHTAVGSGRWGPRDCLPLGSGTLLHTAWGQWAVELLLFTASLPWGSGQWNSFCPLTAQGHWAGELLPFTASLHRGSGQRWCGVVCRRRCYQMAKGRDVYQRAKVNGLGCVCCVRAVRRYVVFGRRLGEVGKTWRAPLWWPSLSEELPLHPLSFRLLVQAQLLQRPRHCAALAQAGL